MKGLLLGIIGIIGVRMFAKTPMFLINQLTFVFSDLPEFFSFFSLRFLFSKLPIIRPPMKECF